MSGGGQIMTANNSQVFCTPLYGGVSRYFCEIASHVAKAPGAQIP